MPERRSAGSATRAPTAAEISTAHTIAIGSPPLAEVRDHDRADAGEAELAQGDLTREPDERDERQRDDSEREHLAVRDEVRIAQRGGAHDADDDDRAGEEEGAGEGGGGEELAAAGHATPQARVRQDQQDDEQDDRGDCEPQPAEVLVLGQVPREIALAAADDDRTEERQRQAPESAEDRRRRTRSR